MITVNGTNYKCFLLDTNILISTIKDKANFGSKILNLVLKDGIFIFSPVSLSEIGMDPLIYKEFKTIFLTIPSFLVMAIDEIIKKECENYYSKDNLDLTNVGLYINRQVFKSKNINLDILIDNHISEEKSSKYKHIEEENFNEIITGMDVGLLKKNNLQDKVLVQQSIELLAYNIIAKHCYSFAKELSERKEVLKVNRFPSVLSMSYLYHYKFMHTRRKGESSDLSDILISSALPYVDYYLTENSVANNIREIKHKFGFYSNLEVLVTRDVKELKTDV